MNSPQTLSMVFCIDDNFAPHLAALLTSIIVNTQPGNSFTFYVFSAELSEDNKKMLYIPEGFAHGYIVTSKNSIVLYKCTNLYNPHDEHGIRWNDDTIGINWNCSSPIISKRDESLPLLINQEFLPEY